MLEKDPIKIEVWLDNKFYNKFEADANGYNVALLLKGFKEKMQQGLIPYAEKIEIRRGL